MDRTLEIKQFLIEELIRLDQEAEALVAKSKTLREKGSYDLEVGRKMLSEIDFLMGKRSATQKVAKFLMEME